jgi:Tol biopolymer transport system component
MIIGTAAYMAPEQAKGKSVDKRADIWAFGVVLYEMLTGRRAFEGEDISTTLAAVLMRDPEWTSLPGDVPPALQHLIRRCLTRDPRERLRDIGEARLLLGDPEALRSGPEPAEAVALPDRSSRLPWIVAAAGLLAAVVFGSLWLTGSTGPPEIERIEASLAPPPGHSIGAAFALSPDGQQLITEAVDRENGTVSLWLRDLSSGVPTRLSVTDGGIMPFWSPDGSEVAFFAEGKLKKTDLQGSPPQVICDAQTPRGGAWGPDGTIVFSASFRTGLEQVDAAGGIPTPLTTLDEDRLEKSHRWPVFLPDGAHVLFLAQTGEATSKDDASTIEVLTIATGVRTRLLMANSSPLYSAAGFVLFWREDALRAQAFDARTLTVSGPVMPVAAGVAFDSNEYALASVSSGTLVYSTADTTNRTDLLLVDRTGRPIDTIAESVLVEGGLALSNDGTRLAAAITADGARDTDIWIYDLDRDTSGPLTFDEGGDRYPLWSTDDTQLAYTNDRVNDGVVFRRFTDGRGQAEQMATNTTGLWSRDWSLDGRSLVVGAVADMTGIDLWRYDLESHVLEPLVDTQFNDAAGALSPDNRWLAYQSDERGRPEIYVQSLGVDEGRWQISNLGGLTPLWRRDGRELYFVTPLGQVMAVEVDQGAAFHAAAPQELFRANFRRVAALDYREYTPTADGQRFVINVLKERSASLVTLVTNWTASIGGTR